MKDHKHFSFSSVDTSNYLPGLLEVHPEGEIGHVFVGANKENQEHQELFFCTS